MDNKCPQCKSILKFISNNRMDFRIEIIPICDNCGKAFRDPKLGWKIIDIENSQLPM